MAGFNFPGSYGQKKKHRTNYSGPEQPEKMETYAGSILQSSEDYDDIMARYRKILNDPNSDNNGLKAEYQKSLGGNVRDPERLGRITDSKDQVYKRGPELTKAFGELEELSRTGGYSEENKADLRARGISPIRSVYANAQTDMRRNRALQGGYSPNFNAASTKMSRDMSDMISQKVTDVNAGIAQNVASNRLNAAPNYAQFAQGETRDINDINSQNVSNRFKTDTFNSGIEAQNVDNRFRADSYNNQSRTNALTSLSGLYGQDNDRDLQALAGMRGMYGATPAQPALYGQQAAEQFRLQPPPPKRRLGGSSHNFRGW